MGFYHLIEQQFGILTKRLFKNYNNIFDQITRINNSKTFLLTCRKEGIIPNFISNKTKKIFTGNEINQKTNNYINCSNKKILNFHISHCCSKLKHNEKQLIQIRQQLERIVPLNLVNEFVHRQKESRVVAKILYSEKTTKKLSSLRKQNPCDIQYDNGWFENLTDRPVPSNVQSLLALGPKFAVKHQKCNFPMFSTIADIEHLAKNIPESCRTTFSGKAATALSNHIHKVNNTTSTEEKHIINCLKETNKYFKENKDLLLVDADKGNTTILVNRLEYINKVESIYNDTDKYTKLNENPTKELQNNNNKLVYDLFKNNFINKQQKRKLMIYKSQAPKPYAVMKLHKPDRPYRLIIASINSPSYHLTKFVNDICQQLINQFSFPFNIRNSYELKQNLDMIKLTDEDILTSFDVISMYEKIHVFLVFSATRKRWRDIENITPIPQELFMKIVRFCVRDSNYVKFNQKYYKAKNGLTIGGCASPILADMVMTDILQSAIDKLGYDPILIKKYVDDIIIICPKEELENTFTVFNSIHQQIQFTMESEEHGQLVYLDMKLLRQANGTILTDFYQKPTNKGRILNYKSSHSINQKTSTAYGLIHRIFSLSSEVYWTKNKDVALNLLTKNNYPPSLVNRLFNKFMIQHKNQTKSLDLQEFDKTIDENIPKKQYLACNYIQGYSEILQKLYHHYQPDVRLAFKSKNNLKSIYPNKKDKIDKMEKTDLIYSIQCKSCEKVYIGQTGQTLCKRMKQHSYDFTNRFKKRKAVSGAVEHSRETGHIFDYSSPKILQMETHLGKRLTLEMLHIITSNQTSVNLKTDIEGLCTTYQQLVNNNR